MNTRQRKKLEKRHGFRSFINYRIMKEAAMLIDIKDIIDSNSFVQIRMTKNKNHVRNVSIIQNIKTKSNIFTQDDDGGKVVTTYEATSTTYEANL